MRTWLKLFFAIMAVSCTTTTHEDYYSFNDYTWNTDSIVKFKYTISDTIKKHKLRLKIRHTVNYEFQNLFLFLDGSHKDTVEIILANKRGEWLGSGISDVREIDYIFDNERVFLKKGNYELIIEQAMRYGPLNKIENLKHILNIGIIVSEYNE